MNEGLVLKKEKKVTSELFGSFSDYIVYEGRNLKGWPVKTIVRGELVADDFEVVGKLGQLVRERPAADSPQQLAHLVEAALAGYVQGSEDLDGPSGAEDRECIDSGIDLPVDVEALVVVV